MANRKIIVVDRNNRRHTITADSWAFAGDEVVFRNEASEQVFSIHSDRLERVEVEGEVETDSSGETL